MSDNAGRPATSPADDLLQKLAAQRTAFLRDGAPTLDVRRGHLLALREAVLNDRERLIEAVSADFGHRSRQETTCLDLLSAVKTIDFLRHNVSRWSKPEPRRVALHFRPGRARVEYQPLGVVGIVSPWNYPIVLALTPLATALAAGNRVMLKPSELAPRTADALAELLKTIFPEDIVSVVQGGADVAQAFTRLPFDRLVFTGSTSIGRDVMRAAAENLVPVTLELGGKSPAIVMPGASLKKAARSIVFGKLANAGQTCIAPDYALVPAGAVDAFVVAFRREVERFYPDIAHNPDYTTIISDRHAARLHALLDDARTGGAAVHQCGSVGESKTTLHPRTFLPRIVTGTTETMGLMREEIFGPILPVVPYVSADEAITFVNARPRPLALYVFGKADPDRSNVLSRIVAGNVTINDTLLHYAQDDLPFGGVGASGMGAYHGHEGFKTMSHARGVFAQSRFNGADWVRPPYGRLFDRLMSFLLR